MAEVWTIRRWQTVLLIAAGAMLQAMAAGQIVGPSRSDRSAGRAPAPAPQKPATRPAATAPSASLNFDRPGMTLLLRRPAKFTDERIALALTRATGEKFAYSARGANYFVSSRFVNTWDIAFGDLAFELFAGDLLPLPERRWPGPGDDAPEQKWAYRAASAEVRVLWVNPNADPDRIRRAGRFVGAVLGDLCNDDCLAVMRFEGERLSIQPRTAVTVRELRSPQPTLACEDLSGEPPPPDRDRARVDEAQAKARATWPLFLDGLSARQPDDVFAVLVRGEGEPRYLLVESVATEGQVQARAPSGGANVRVSPTDVIDWVACREGRIEGRFYGTAARELRLERYERGAR